MVHSEIKSCQIAFKLEKKAEIKSNLLKQFVEEKIIEFIGENTIKATITNNNGTIKLEGKDNQILLAKLSLILCRKYNKLNCRFYCN
ncbi:hypothetical protein NUSPORA_01934 [Nucleospora cyclopteri]